MNKGTKTKYQPPELIPLGELARGLGNCDNGAGVDGNCLTGSGASNGNCEPGSAADQNCATGFSPTDNCDTGSHGA